MLLVGASLVVLVPWGIGFVTALVPGVLGWILFALVAAALGVAAWFGEGLRKAIGSDGPSATWHFWPLGMAILGRIMANFVMPNGIF